MGVFFSLISCAASPAADLSKHKDTLSEQAFISEEQNETEISSLNAEPDGISILRRAYPDVTFDATYDDAAGDWKISITAGEHAGELYWCDGKLLPEDKLAEKDNYWKLFYKYPEKVADPKDFSPEEIERIRNFSSPENRREGASSPQFFYNLIYDCETRRAVEQHITKVSFLGKRSNIHERIKEPLAAVEKQILEAAETDPETKAFVDTLASADSYNWREISDSGSRSFHSMGIAVDVLPRGWGQKNIYWAWRRDIDPENWMLLPLDRRWTPPQTVIRIFEKNGFIWGGKWTIWDNMHFEYRPEVIIYSNEYNTSGKR